MNKTTRAIACLLLLLDPFTAIAAGNRTSLALKSPNCHFDAASEGLDCKGPNGWSVAIGYHTLRRTIVLIPPGKTVGNMRGPADGLAVIPVDIAPPATAIWSTSAVIVPVLIVLPDDFERIAGIGTGVNGVPTRRILEVFRLGQEGSCAIAYIDGSDPTAQALAGQASAGAEHARCPVASVAMPGKAAETLAAYIKE